MQAEAACFILFLDFNEPLLRSGGPGIIYREFGRLQKEKNMEEKIVDARGKTCPEPLIMTKKALKDLALGQKMQVLVDNETSKNNVSRFLADNAVPVHCTEKNGIFVLHVNKTSEELSKPDAASYCSPGTPGEENADNVIVISSDKMGGGPDELGAILIKAFINTIKETQPLPGKIVFYNSGILLAAEGSPVIDSLRELEKSGVAILVCGTCVNYFGKQDRIMAGTISNMYTILETLTAAGKVIRP
jgi:selenium metabolism protein YedF